MVCEGEEKFIHHCLAALCIHTHGALDGCDLNVFWHLWDEVLSVKLPQTLCALTPGVRAPGAPAPVPRGLEGVVVVALQGLW